MSEWASWIGRQSTCDDVLDPQQANRMAVTLDREPAFQVGDALPPAWQWLYFHDVIRASQLGDGGHPRLGVTMPPVPLPRRMWAGGRLDFFEPLRLGERVQRVSTIRSIVPKEGRTGPLYFVTVEHAFSTDGQRNLHELQTIVYRAMSPTADPPRASAAPSSAPSAAEFVTTWSLDNIALFRYSALTFNGHRIHFDADYSRDVEGYPNIVVHGPLIATLLLDLAHRNGRPMARFTYRARSPLFLPSPFTVNGAGTPGGTRLWAADDTGGLAMEADVLAEPKD
jgi:3-methylfumaryl-CoA hydratase